MHEYMEWSVGLFGLICLVGSIKTPGFPNKSSNPKALIALIAMLVVFIVSMDGAFKTMAEATPVQLFGFIGEVLGVLGVLIAAHARYPRLW